MISLIDLCLLEDKKLSSQPRSIYKSTHLSNIWKALDGSLSNMRLWLTAVSLMTNKENPYHVIALSRHPPPYDNTNSSLYSLFILANLSDETNRCIQKFNIYSPNWPSYIDNINAGLSIIDNTGEVLCWAIETKFKAINYTILEYINHKTTLAELLLNHTTKETLDNSLYTIFSSLLYAWNLDIVYTQPHPKHLLLHHDSPSSENIYSAVWTHYDALQSKTSKHDTTILILRVFASYFEISYNISNPNILRDYLEEKMDILRIPHVTRRLLRNCKCANNIPDSSFLIWERNISFEEVLSLYSNIEITSKNISINSELIKLPLKTSPSPYEGFIYSVLNVGSPSTLDDLQSSEESFTISFTSTKYYIERYLDSAITKSYNIAKNSSIFDTSKDKDDIANIDDINEVFSLFADWITIRTLVDALETRLHYRNMITNDTISSNVSNYVIEIRSKLVRMTGEWEPTFLNLKESLDYASMDSLTYMWTIIRDLTSSTR